MTLLAGDTGVGLAAPSHYQSPLAARPAAHPYFTRKAGELLSAHVAFKQSPPKPRPASIAARLGLRFEAKCLKRLQAEFGIRFASHICFGFQSLTEGGRSIIPDGLIFSPDYRTVTIVEVKLRHTTDAFFQLHDMYLPIVRRALPGFRVTGLELVLYYDPRLVLPKSKAIISHPREAISISNVYHPILIADKKGAWL